MLDSSYKFRSITSGYDRNNDIAKINCTELKINSTAYLIMRKLKENSVFNNMIITVCVHRVFYTEKLKNV